MTIPRGLAVACRRLSRAIAVAVIAAIFCVYPNAAVDRGAGQKEKA